jgi:hypothetical protein
MNLLLVGGEVINLMVILHIQHMAAAGVVSLKENNPGDKQIKTI